MQIAYIIAGKLDQYAILKLWKYSQCSENVNESRIYRVYAEKADHLRYSLAHHMSIVFMECSIAMYYTKRSGGRSSEKSENAKTEWEVACLFRKLLFAAARPA